MLIILPHDKENYINHNILRNIKSGNGLYLPEGNDGGAGIYLPGNNCEYCGKGFGDIISTVFRFINSNKDNIKNLTDSGSNIINLASATSKGVTDTIKNIKEIQSQNQRLRDGVEAKGGELFDFSRPNAIAPKKLPKKNGPGVSSGSGLIYY